MRKGRNRKWNHNTHYYDVVMAAAPPTAKPALDVGTDDGLLTVSLSTSIPEVTGIDTSAEIIATAHANTSKKITWIVDDVLTHPLREAHFGVVAAVATVHHYPDPLAGLRRLATLTAPGGSLVTIGCARSSTVPNYAVDVIGVAQHKVLSRTRGYWQHNAPVQMEFPHLYTEVKRIAADVLPGMTWRRLPLWRYAITWRRPT